MASDTLQQRHAGPAGPVASPSRLRASFAERMGELYREEVPRYADLIELVERVNADTLRSLGDSRHADGAYVARRSRQCHGAIRVGKPSELALLARLFAQFGMEPVGFYDLVPAGLPVFSTAFRPTDPKALAVSPFRIFCSLLRSELIDDTGLRGRVIEALESRRIVARRLEELIEAAEAAGGVALAYESEFIDLAVDVFRWQGRSRVGLENYRAFAASHRLIADIAAFPGPHINHLTPSAIDIDAVQSAMVAARLNAKAVVEGPPPRRCPILLRQTAFNAVEETVDFPTEGAGAIRGTHTARFGEVEQRGAALTPAGRALYDRCLAHARGLCDTATAREDPMLYQAALVEAFAAFPDDWLTMLDEDLVYCRFRRPGDASGSGEPLEDLSTREALLAAVRDGRVLAEPISYEDFLPVSAAGIFRSNLGEGAGAGDAGSGESSQSAFEEALGRGVIDPHELYARVQAESLAALRGL